MHAAQTASMSPHAGVLHFMAACMRVAALAHTPARSLYSSSLPRPAAPQTRNQKFSLCKDNALQLVGCVHAGCSAAAVACETAHLSVGLHPPRHTLAQAQLKAQRTDQRIQAQTLQGNSCPKELHMLRNTGPCKRCTKKWRSRSLRWLKEGIVPPSALKTTQLRCNFPCLSGNVLSPALLSQGSCLSFATASPCPVVSQSPRC